jgi:hypothetical protein
MEEICGFQISARSVLHRFIVFGQTLGRRGSSAGRPRNQIHISIMYEKKITHSRFNNQAACLGGFDRNRSVGGHSCVQTGPQMNTYLWTERNPHLQLQRHIRKTAQDFPHTHTKRGIFWRKLLKPNGANELSVATVRLPTDSALYRAFERKDAAGE